jgi:hypothetical protein
MKEWRLNFAPGDQSDALYKYQLIFVMMNIMIYILQPLFLKWEKW